MSCDLAVWEGPLPASDTEAAGEFERRMDVTDRWPEESESPPWSDGRQ
ncbi:MAG TPA: hypothetical protein VHZ81_13650 [Galbitalea sp.]|nr:hypothetical protein [Galbitalea sp.]